MQGSGRNNDRIDTAVVAGNFAALNVRTCSLRRRIRGISAASVVLDNGTGIDPRSLRRVGSILRWHHDGAARSAAL